MKEQMGRDQKEKRERSQIEPSSEGEVRVLPFPEGALSQKGKKKPLPHSKEREALPTQEKIDNDLDNPIKEKEKTNLSFKKGAQAALEELEEKEKRLKYHIRELESFFGLS